MNSWEQLSERQRAIIEHVARYRVSTDDILQELFYPEATSVNSVQKSIIRMVRAGWLDKSSSVGRRNVYYLGDNFHLPRSRRGGFSEQTLPAAIAILYFCIRQHHKRIAISELRGIDPDLAAPGVRGSAYFADEIDGKWNLSHMLVDRLGPVRRTVWKVKRLVGQRKRRPVYLKWILHKRFSITVLTATTRQADQLRGGFKAAGPLLVPVRVQVVPEFAPFLPISK